MKIFNDYHLDTTHVSKSGLDLVSKAPYLYWYKYLNKNKTPEPFNEAYLVGGSFHTFVLEPELLDKEYIVMPDFKGTGSTYKKQSFINANPSKKIISHKTYMQIYGMSEAVRKHPIASKLFSGGVAEMELTWIDSDTGVKCKCKPDYLKQSSNAIIDLKSTVDASLRGFKNSARKFRYDVQSAYYLDGANANNLDITKFIFVAVEKKPPYLVNVFFSDNTTTNTGRNKYKDNLQVYKECLDNGEWNGYDTMIKPLEIEY